MKYRTATQWGVFDVTVSDGVIQRVDGIQQDPDPAAIGQTLLDGVQHASRIQRPAIRKGWLAAAHRNRKLRGNDSFVDVPWDEALDMAALKLNCSKPVGTR